MQKYRSLATLVIFLGVLINMCMNPASASIQDEVDEADSGDTITVASGIYKENIHIDKSLIIKGAGVGNTVFDGNQAGSVIVIGENDANINVILSNITIQNGSANKGGGIYNQGNLKMLNAAVTGNNASWGGGGIFNNHTLTMNNSTISGNKAPSWGAGVYNADTFKINCSSITKNEGRYYTSGGGIYNSGILIINNSYIIGNRAHLGSGIKNSKKGNAADWQEQAIFIMNQGIISGNRGQRGAFGEESLGGGVDNQDEFIMLSGKISENSADDAGGLDNGGGSSSISGTSQIIRNQATSSYGGGIYSGSVVLDGSETVIKYNQANMPSPSELSWYQGWGIYLPTNTPITTGGFDPALQVAENVLYKANYRPNKPSMPLGPENGVIGTSYAFSTSTTDQDEDQVKYIFDWGDGTIEQTAFINSGEESNAIHSWSTPGIYNVKVISMDSNGGTSDWSTAAIISIAEKSAPRVDLSLYVEDALAPKDMSIMVNKMPGDKVDVVAVVTNRGNSPLTFDVELNPIPPELGLPEKGIIRLSFNPLSEIEEIGSGITTIQFKDLGPGEARQIVWRFEVSNSAIPKSIMIGARAKINGKTHSESAADINIVNNAEAIIFTNRYLLYKNYDYNEVSSLLNYVYKLAKQDSKNCLIYCVDQYDRELENWDQNEDYTDEDKANEIANKIDDIIEDRSKDSDPDYLLILGGDKIIPFYKIFDDTNDEQSYFGVNYYDTDLKYSDLDDINWKSGDSDLSVGRISGVTARGMENFIRNSLEGPNSNCRNALVATRTASDGSEWRDAILPGDDNDAIEILRDNFGFDILNDTESPITVETDSWTKNDLIHNMKKGSGLVLFMDHGDYDRIICPDTRLYSDEIKDINKENSINDNNTFFYIHACHTGYTDHIGSSKIVGEEWDDCFVHALIKEGTSGVIASTGIAYSDWNPDRVAYGEELANDFFVKLGETTSPKPFGEVLRDTKLDWSRRNLDRTSNKTLTEYNFYGVPWGKLNLNNPGLRKASTSTTSQSSDVTINISNPIHISGNRFAKNIEINVTGYFLDKINDYYLININGSKSISRAYEPDIPGIEVALPLPVNSTLGNVTITGSTPVSVGMYYISPRIPSSEGYSNSTSLNPYTNITGIFPGSIVYFTGVSNYKYYKTAGVTIALAQYNTTTNETIIYKNINLQVAYETSTTSMITGINPAKSEFSLGEPINVSASIENIGSNKTTGLQINMDVVDLFGTLRSKGSSPRFDLLPGDSREVLLQANNTLPHGAYDIQISLVNGTELLGRSKGSIYISTGTISGFSLPEKVVSGNEIPFNITFLNNNGSAVNATAFVSIFDPNHVEIANTESLSKIVASGSQVQMETTWNTLGKEPGVYRAAAYVSADGEYFGPEYIDFTILKYISGTKFNDTNFNATRDPGEAGLSGWTIRLTRPDGTTINATTDANGGYKFENLTSGTYRVSEVRQDNWTQTYPAWLGDHIINVTDGSVTGVDFGNNYLPVPDIPFPPAGPASGIPGAEYSYSTSAADPSGYQISYTFDWGDGTNSTTGLFDSGAVASSAHIWNSSGVYQVRAMATNSKGASSEWSSELEVTIEAGNIPDQIGVFRNGGLYFDANGDGYWTAGDTTGWFGATGDLPVAGDWDGNGKDEIAVFRNGGWYFDANGDGYWTTGDTTGWFGATGDLPAAGDWDGNGKDEVAVFRNGGWYFDANGDGYWTSGDTTGWFGATGDQPAAGDWDGDGKDEIAVFRNGGWYFDANGDRYWTEGDTTGWFGATGDLPAAGDWDGDGKDEIAVFRNGGWYFDANGDGYWTTGDTTGWFGAGGDRPVAGRWGSSFSALAMGNDKPQLDLREMSAEKIRQKRAALEELQEESRDQKRETKMAQETLLEKHGINSLKP